MCVKNKKVLTVAPYPDDEVLCYGGTLTPPRKMGIRFMSSS
jgi:LmbE family N-acetylglucosaminyl deacetylase